MFKKLLAIIVAFGLLFPTTLVRAEGTGPVQRLGTGIPTSIAASPDGKTLAVGSSIGVWFLDATTLAPSGFWDTGMWVDSVAYSVDGLYLQVNEMVYEVAKGHVVEVGEMTWVDHRCSFDGRLCAKDFYHPHDPTVLVSSQVIDTDTAISLKILERSTKSVAWSVSRARLYTVFYDWRRLTYVVKEWDTQTWQTTLILEGFFTNHLTQVLWASDGTEIASSRQIWSVADAKFVRSRYCLYGDTNGTFACQWPAMGYHYRNVRFYDFSTGHLQRTFVPHHLLLLSAALSNDNHWLATSGEDRSYDCHYVTGYFRDQPYTYYTCTGLDTSTRIWDSNSLTLLTSLPQLFYALSFSPDGALVVGITASGIEAWDWQSNRKIWSVEDGASCARYPQYWGDAHKQCLSVSSDNKYVADYINTSPNYNAHLYNLTTGELVATLIGHTAPITGVAFSPDGTKVATSSQDGTILIWDVP